MTKPPTTTHRIAPAPAQGISSANSARGSGIQGAAEPTGAGFDTLALSQASLANLTQLGYVHMTPIQAASLPLALAGHDLIAQARTGSGKTVAFALALLSRLGATTSPNATPVQALVLCPTRELADQVSQAVRQLARAQDNVKVLTLCGGVPLRGQLASLEHGAHVVVGTPGRVIDHLQRGSLMLAGLRTLVLDEADRMLDMGFAADIAEVARQCPGERQTLLFSATYPPGIAEMASKLLRAPREVKLAAQHAPTTIRQQFIEVRDEQRLHAVSLVLRQLQPTSTLAFCNTRAQCHALVAVLRAQGIAALELHGELEQRERDQVMVRFANRSASVLVATDIAARGLDVAQLDLVINVDMALDADTHTHRIGRTGRADAVGVACSLASMDEMGRVGQIEQAMGLDLQWLPLSSLSGDAELPRAPMKTLQILGGRKEKIRAGDVLGALTKDLGYAGAVVGKINVNEFSTYVAVERSIAHEVERRLAGAKIKGKTVKVRLLAD